MRRTLRYLLVILCCNLLFLFAPKNECNDLSADCPFTVIRINSIMGFHMSWDGYKFISYAQHPKEILNAGNERQSRPLFIAMGSAAGYSLWYISRPFHHFITGHLKPTTSGQFDEDPEQSLKTAVFLAGFIFLNILVMLATLWLFESSMLMSSGKWKHKKWLMNAMLVMLTACQLSKIFFWTPHQQLFALFTPVLCLWICFRLTRSPGNSRLLFSISAVCGLLLLVYGNLLLTLPCLLLAYAIPARKLYPVRRIAGTGLVALIIFILPTLLWIAYVRSTGIPFLSEELTRYRQFIWIADELSVSFSNFFRVFAKNTAAYALTFGNMVFAAGLLLLSLFITGTKRNKERYPRASHIILLTGVLVFVFYWMLGYYADRLTYTLAPILLFYAAHKLNTSSVTIRQQIVVLIFITLSIVYIFFRDAPHLSLDYYR